LVGCCCCCCCCTTKTKCWLIKSSSNKVKGNALQQNMFWQMRWCEKEQQQKNCDKKTEAFVWVSHVTLSSRYVNQHTPSLIIRGQIRYPRIFKFLIFVKPLANFGFYYFSEKQKNSLTFIHLTARWKSKLIDNNDQQLTKLYVFKVSCKIRRIK